MTLSVCQGRSIHTDLCQYHGKRRIGYSLLCYRIVNHLKQSQALGNTGTSKKNGVSNHDQL